MRWPGVTVDGLATVTGTKRAAPKDGPSYREMIVWAGYRLLLPRSASANSSDTSMSLCSRFHAFSLDQLTPSFS